jgi:hypothetical protein
MRDLRFLGVAMYITCLLWIWCCVLE